MEGAPATDFKYVFSYGTEIIEFSTQQFYDTYIFFTFHISHEHVQTHPFSQTNNSKVFLVDVTFMEVCRKASVSFCYRFPLFFFFYRFALQI